MRIYDRDYRYLLLNLLPTHRLPAAIRRDVDRALRGGSPDELRRQSLRALEALCDADYLERGDVRHDNGNVVLGYRRRGARYQLSVALPRSEWERFGADAGPARETPGHAEVPVRDAGAPPAQRAGESAAPRVAGALEILPDIARSFAISDRGAPVLHRLDILLGTLERWLDLRSSRLDIIEDALVIGGAEAGTRVHVVSEAQLRESEPVQRAIEAGARRLVPQGAGEGEVLGVAPIFAVGNVVGVLRAGFAGGLDRATMDARLEAAASVVRHVIEFHHQFESLTSIDSLTGIYNRQFFDRQMPVEIERAMRSGSALTLVVLDIDDFKRVNDEMGHKKGDEALVAVADIIRRNLRKVDMPFRYGGEEIVILLPGTPEFEALHTAERLRRVINQHRGFRDLHGNTRVLSVSIGVAVYPDTARTAEQLFEQADAAMYRAKQRGKNQVVLFSSM